MSHCFTDADRKKSYLSKLNEAAPRILKEGTHPGGDYLRRILIEVKKKEYVCEFCGIDKWQNQKLKLQVDHINGIHHDNRYENLRFLCPNCHSLTDTFCGAGNTGSHKVIDKDLIDAIISSKNIRNALIKVGLTPKGGNYTRVRELVAKHNLSFNC
jgi:5-methylcytosine-specific restriction endonuclease McrA